MRPQRQKAKNQISERKKGRAATPQPLESKKLSFQAKKGAATASESKKPNFREKTGRAATPQPQKAKSYVFRQKKSVAKASESKTLSF